MKARLEPADDGILRIHYLAPLGNGSGGKE